jgi:phospholipid-binding lipoprotein MlaA
VPPGPYVVLPFLGPSSARDTVGFVADQFTDPKTYVGDPYLLYGGTALSLVDQRAELLGADDVLDRSYDPYVFLRNAYLQRREFQVKDGSPPPEEQFEIFEDEAPADSPAGAAQPAPPNSPR